MHGDTVPWNVSKFQQTILQCIHNTYTSSFFCTDLKKIMFKVTFVSRRKNIFSMKEVEDLHILD